MFKTVYDASFLWSEKRSADEALLSQYIIVTVGYKP